uniref:Uncharacterized protein n=1 Tax=Anguilla anguilla TaxID=7936 RepID=A0A0E9PQC5_ANGAN
MPAAQTQLPRRNLLQTSSTFHSITLFDLMD